MTPLREAKEMKAVAIIRRFLSDNLAERVADVEVVGELFYILEQQNKINSASRRYFIRGKIHQLKMKGSLGTHAEEMKNLFADMEATGKGMDEEEKIFYFLESLCPSLENVKTLLETNVENLTFQSCLYKLQDHVNRQELKLKSEVPKVFAVTKRCFTCRKVGHTKNECWHNKGPRKVANSKPRRTWKAKVNVAKPIPKDSVATEDQGFVYMVSHNTLDSFIIDSGATHHVVRNVKLTYGFKELVDPIQLGSFDKSTNILAVSQGDINIRGDDGRVVLFKDVLYVPNGSANILSVRKLQKSGIKVTFDNDEHCSVYIEVDGKIWIKQRVNSYLNIPFEIEFSKINTVGVSCNFKLWHRRLGHIGDQKFKDIVKNDLVGDSDLIEGLTVTKELCEECITAKQSRLPFNKAKEKSLITRPLQAVSSDVCGPITPKTFTQKSYFVTFIGNFRRLSTKRLQNLERLKINL